MSHLPPRCRTGAPLLTWGPAGVAKWNRWRKEAAAIAPLKKIDLAEKDLTGAQLEVQVRHEWASTSAR